MKVVWQVCDIHSAHLNQLSCKTLPPVAGHDSQICQMHYQALGLIDYETKHSLHTSSA